MTTDIPSTIDPVRIQESIELLKMHYAEQEIASLIAALEAVGQNPDDKANLDQLSEVFNSPTVAQGAILTFAPYIGILLSDDFCGSHFD